MDFLTYLNIGDTFSIWLKSLHVVFSMTYEGVYQFLFQGQSIDVTSILGQYGINSIEFGVPQIPVLSDIGGGIFTLLFFDTHFAHMPFYFSFAVALLRVTFIVLIIDIISKIAKRIVSFLPS